MTKHQREARRQLKSAIESADIQAIGHLYRSDVPPALWAIAQALISVHCADHAQPAQIEMFPAADLSVRQKSDAEKLGLQQPLFI